MCDAALPRAPGTACVKKLLSLGTTTAVYYASIHLQSTMKLADICLALGQRALVGKVRFRRGTERGRSPRRALAADVPATSGVHRPSRWGRLPGNYRASHQRDGGAVRVQG